MPYERAEVFENDDVVIREYSNTSERMNLASKRINGRYPISGYTVNTEVDALIQITEGKGSLTTVNGAEALLSKGDQVHITKDEAYFFKGNLELLYAASPKWTPEQTRHID